MVAPIGLEAEDIHRGRIDSNTRDLIKRITISVWSHRIPICYPKISIACYDLLVVISTWVRNAITRATANIFYPHLICAYLVRHFLGTAFGEKRVIHRVNSNGEQRI